MFLVMASPTAFAGLGGKIDSVVVDQALLQAEAPTVADHGNYSVYSMKTGSSTVNYYADHTGNVFAVTWRGLAHPDLSVVLDKKFKRYQRTLAERKLASQKGLVRATRYSQVVSGNTVVQKFGHMRDFRGVAYESTLFPVGVTLNELK
jgi:hypothetical protein